jgi:circadian clock protein KaiC
MGLTIVLTVETPGDPGGALSRYGIEEFVADSVVLLRNVREGTFRRRTVEVLKMRGAMHHKGDVPFTWCPARAWSCCRCASRAADRPRPPADDRQRRARRHDRRRPVRRLLHAGDRADRHRQDAAGHPVPRRRCRGRRADGHVRLRGDPRAGALQRPRLGHDLEQYEADGRLVIVPAYPEVASLDDHLVELQAVVDRVQPTRIAVDSLSALERLGSPTSFREYVIGLTSFVKESGMASLVTSSARSWSGRRR